ncbi:hypothetical protein GCM10009841_02240 [Microlunatus panaciterrae]|uniref:Glycoside hydrolase family 5 domain-containing protein n=1 Tax=Microlunatus panaciterrae TaxID=400768 RepID=A0ABS2RLQ8_9ACTN|nr:cellulase family glycosylhydrolase [Microlunatus panaciterrae]MBM7799111.1 hypothetical protein [Microlunatus panaciterrae]
MGQQLAGLSRTAEPPATLSRHPRRRRLIAAGAALSLIAGLATFLVSSNSSPDCVDSPVTAQALSDLGGYVDWLHKNKVRGYVGEVGWPSGPDARDWNEVASHWYDAADRDGLWVTAWAAGKWWPDSYQLTVYRLTGAREPADAGAQAAVVEAHADVSGALRGVDLPSGAFASGPEGPSTYSGTTPGRYGRDYYYEDAADLRQVAKTGADVVRISVTWERLQHQPGGPLDQTELERVRATLRAAETVGLGVVLDLHNYGDYWVADGSGHRRLTLGTPDLPDDQFADLWRQLSTALRDSTAIIGYGLMNEPTNLAADPTEGAHRWQVASQAAVQAIRQTGDHRTVFVTGYGGASPSQWVRYHPRAWIDDPADQVRYETHQYFDTDRTGRYTRTFREETLRARGSGFGTFCPATKQ